MSQSGWLVVYCVLILLASLAGGWIPFLVKLTHKRMELAVSFVAGVMLGVGLLHMLPHAYLARVEAEHEAANSTAAVELAHTAAHDLINPIVLWLLAGFLVMFFIERFFCFHHHDPPAQLPSGGAETDRQPVEYQHDHADHGDDQCNHHDRPHHHPNNPSKTRHHLTWTGAAIGLSVHSLIEGIALAASVQVGHEHGDGAGIIGLGTFLVIFLHKPFDSLTIGTLMSMGQRSPRSRHMVNFAFSLLVLAGVLLFQFGLVRSSGNQALVSGALAFSAGTFLCIAMSDLLPELQFHQHDRGKLSAALLSGLALAWIIGVMESRMHEEHDHDHAVTPPNLIHDHEH